MASLAQVLTSHPSFLISTHLIFVPGPSDPNPTATIPRAPLPKSLTKPLTSKLDAVQGCTYTMTSNPCRVFWGGKELVVFRDGTMQRMMRNSIRIGVGKKREGEEEGDMKKYVRRDFRSSVYTFLILLSSIYSIARPDSP
jgi:DNA polymerase epsilon subunit 2